MLKFLDNLVIFKLSQKRKLIAYFWNFKFNKFCYLILHEAIKYPNFKNTFQGNMFVFQELCCHIQHFLLLNSFIGLF